MRVSTVQERMLSRKTVVPYIIGIPSEAFKAHIFPPKYNSSANYLLVLEKSPRYFSLLSLRLVGQPFASITLRMTRQRSLQLHSFPGLFRTSALKESALEPCHYDFEGITIKKCTPGKHINQGAAYF